MINARTKRCQGRTACRAPPGDGVQAEHSSKAPACARFFAPPVGMVLLEQGRGTASIDKARRIPYTETAD